MVLHPGAGYTFAAFLLVAFLIARRAADERRAVGVCTALFVASLALLAGGNALVALGEAEAGGVLRNVGIYSEGLCLIYIAALLVFRVILPAARLQTPRIILDVAVAVAAIAWAAVWLRMNRVDLTSIVATSAVVSAVVAFSLQDTLGNILGGIAIQLDQSITVGDWIEINDVVGRVTEVRWRHTSLETRDWETVVVPNALLVKNQFRVLGKRTGEPIPLLRRTVPFTVEYGHAPTEVVRAVEEAVRANQAAGVSQRPQPVCLVLGFGDSLIEYGVRYWLSDLTQDDAWDSEVRKSIYFGLRRAGLPFSIPQQTVFLTHDTEERRLSHEQRHLLERMDALRRLEVFAGLEDHEIERLAHSLAHAPFAPGEIITRQGAEAEWLYLIQQGTADVLVERPGSEASKVAELGPGTFFGEMGLMTGETRAATVIARTPVESYRLGREAFREVLEARPEIAQGLSEILAQRRLELDAARETLDSAARQARLRSTRDAILHRIQSFFGLPGRR
jgi:small-conductance mechanosensitive channel/CRP-like cAMP-binding protein